MADDDEWMAAPRMESELSGLWGLYSGRQGIGLDMVFSSERDARDSLRVLVGRAKRR